MNEHALRTLILAGILVPASFADDFYVDAQGGSDAATGTLGDPWRTLTHAAGQISVGSHTLHVSTGTYDGAHGEVFPIGLSAGWTVRGVGDVTVEAAQNQTCFDYQPLDQSVVVLDTLRLRGARGVSIYVDWGNSEANVTVRNVDASVSYIFIEAYTVNPIFAGTLTLENVYVHDGLGAIVLDESDCADAFTLNGTDCTFERLNYGVTSGSAGLLSTLNFTRCLFRDITGDAITAGLTNITLDSCLIEGCRDAVDVNSWYGWGTVTLRHTTIAGNIGIGVSNAGTLTSIFDSILWNNADDISVSSGNLNVDHSNVQDGDQQGQNGTISQDPLFRDAASGDYRLTFGSPCVDSGALGGTDLDGFAFDSDGDLDTIAAPDMGSYELRTLLAPHTAAIGTKLHLDLAGDVGQFSAFFLGRAEPMTVPDVTPFGLRWIPEVQLELIGTHKILGPEGARHTVHLPNAQALVGLTFSFQALTRSTVAPLGAAWSDVVAVEFTP